jgi:hypothetical protein
VRHSAPSWKCSSTERSAMERSAVSRSGSQTDTGFRKAGHLVPPVSSFRPCLSLIAGLRSTRELNSVRLRSRSAPERSKALVDIRKVTFRPITRFCNRYVRSSPPLLRSQRLTSDSIPSVWGRLAHLTISNDLVQEFELHLSEGFLLLLISSQSHLLVAQSATSLRHNTSAR